MTIELQLPDDVARDLSSADVDLSRVALESLALEGYRDGRLSEEQVRRLLGFESRFEVHAFLKKHHTPLDYSMADLVRDLELVRNL